MLIKFEVENFRGFKDKLSFDLSNVKGYDFNRECVENGTIKKSIIYGKNGSGKSNLGIAITDLLNHLLDISNLQNPHFHSHYKHGDRADETTKFEYTFKFGNNIVKYSYEKDGVSTLLNEFLVINDKKIIEYIAGSTISIGLQGAQSLIDVVNQEGNPAKILQERNISVIKWIRNNSLLIADTDNKVFDTFFKFVEKMLFFRSVEANAYIGKFPISLDIYLDIYEKGHLDQFQELIRAAGIDVLLEFQEQNGNMVLMAKFKDKFIPFSEIASSGTKVLTLFYYWLQRLNDDEVSFVFIDEFDANYHHELSAQIVNIIKSLNAQVILTTHDTSLMTNDLMRPDCCFLLNENKSIKPLFALSDKELRLAHNIEKMYRAGAFSVSQ